MVLSLSKLNYRVCAPEGASGHFIGHFLHPEFKATQTDLRVDNPQVTILFLNIQAIMMMDIAQI